MAAELCRALKAAGCCLASWLLLVALAGGAGRVLAQDVPVVEFEVAGFAVTGRNPLTDPETQAVLTPFIGRYSGLDGLLAAVDALQAQADADPVLVARDGAGVELGVVQELGEFSHIVRMPGVDAPVHLPLADASERREASPHHRARRAAEVSAESEQQA